jgi:membrane protein YqaA with SNARE-associated domain
MWNSLWAPSRLGTVVGLLVACGVLIGLLPESRDLVWFGLYTVPSHMLVSPFPHEPALLYAAQHSSLWTVTLVATVGCCVAGLFDYWVLTPLLSDRKVRAKLEAASLYRKSERWFRRWPFAILVVTHIAPVPVQPFKLLSVATGYPLWKYLATMIVGRGPRFYLLAWLGYVLQPPVWLLAALTLALVVPLLWQYLPGRRGPSEPAAAATAGAAGPEAPQATLTSVLEMPPALLEMDGASGIA